VAIQGRNVVRITSWLGPWDRQIFEWAHRHVRQALILPDAVAALRLQGG
jgi:uncharacterized protein YjlB